MIRTDSAPEQVSDWKQCRLKDIAASVKHALVGGPFGSNLVQRDYVETGVPVIRGQNMGERWIGGEFVFVTPEKAAGLVPNIARPGDVVFTQRGTLGQVAVVPEQPFSAYVISQSQMKLTVDFSMADPHFIYYLFKSPRYQAYMHDHAMRAGVPHVNLDILRNLPVSLPPLHTQQDIARVLGAFDDLIDNNTRRIKILEEMARRIWREWFTARSSRDWRLGQLKEIADVNARSIGAGADPDSISYLDIAGMGTGRIETLQRMPWRGAPGRARRLVSHGDTVWSMVRPERRSYCLILHPRKDMVLSTGFAVISPKKVPFSFLYLAATTDEFVAYLANRGKGVAYPAVHPSDFESAPIMIPSEKVLDSFHKRVAPILELRQALDGQLCTARLSRNLLLPSLLSGCFPVA